jgi:S-adenosylmethionine:tRNA ribosyltransferase-isomerase
MSSTLTTSLEFELPDELAAAEPPEARGLTRDGVKLMVSRIGDDVITHTRFHRLPEYLNAGDVLVVNSSATIHAAFNAVRQTSGSRPERVLLHLSTPLSNDWWVVELRRITANGSAPLLNAEAGETIRLPGGARATLIVPFNGDASGQAGARLWLAQMCLSADTLAYSAYYGAPIRYRYVKQEWPLSYYQTVFANEPGSVEMPSAARPFTSDVVRRLEAKGVQIAPIVLHTGVSSLEAEEPPYPEKYRVPRATAAAINHARGAGARVIAVGTTAVRAVESAASADGIVQPSEGWTNLMITPERGFYVVAGLLTGLHAPNASHLWMLEALAGQDHLVLCYVQALRHEYLWHEFGDVHLILG